MKKHIIFDFDDTLSSSYDLNQQLFYETFLPYSSELDEDYIRALHKASRGVSMHDQFQNVIDKFGLNISADQLAIENEELHKKRAGDMTIFEGVDEILNYFKSNAKVLSICSNRNTGSLLIILKKYGLDKYFDNIISCIDMGHQKPDPYCLIDLMKKYPNIPKDQVIYFGDSKTDADFASNAGIDYLIVDHYLNSKKYYAMSLQSFASVEDELLVEVDKDNKEIGTIYKHDAHINPNRFHRAAHIVVFTTKGKVVLQKRSHQKRYDPDMWDTIGGHQAFGMSIDQTAEAELYEELGIKGNLTFVRTGLKQDGKQSEYFNLYSIIHNGPYSADVNEVAEIKEFDCKKLLNREYDSKYKILPHVYDYVAELTSLWS